ncbi:MBL fold metallo-hydrolase [Bacteroides nordii]|jgi:hypothetical protein|uniref:MBL fold metallo-hydrolase n=1 Tax=Bacteroides nordii TaxID=291645 RepID=UPI00242BBB41|nr:MBL fold metallo-hydrolase [Bacteroides nordii]
MLVGLTLKGVLLTHVLFDHIYGLNELLEEYPLIDVHTNRYGMIALNDPMENISCYHETSFRIKDNSNVVCLNGGDSVGFKDVSFNIFKTPGHDPSCLCYEIDGMLFTGDSFIPGMKVFTKFQNSNKKQASASFDRLVKMSEKFKIYAGHFIDACKQL